MFVLLFVALHSPAQLWINEVLFNPPAGAENTAQYAELRGTPNLLLTNVYFIAVEGDASGNPGSIQNIFELNGVRVGGNGFIVLLQSSNHYAPNSAATLLVNTNGLGFGNGGDSGAHHRGEFGQGVLEPASVTFFLVQANQKPHVGDDIDADNDGLPDGSEFASWAVFDSVGVLDNSGPGDIAYGQINFRRASPPGSLATAARGNVVSLDFTPGYVARFGNSTNWNAGDWVAGNDLAGAAPSWVLSRTLTLPASLAGKPLRDLGAVNFSRARLAGIILGGSPLELAEDGKGSYTLALNLKASGGLTAQIAAPAGLEVSVDRGKTFGASRQLKLSARPKPVFVRAANDDDAAAPVRELAITNTVASTGDGRYLGAIVPETLVRVTDDEFIVLSEIKANPPGEDEPFEFVELRGTPNALLTNLFLLSVEGNAEANPGVATTVISLDGVRVGTNGLVLVLATNSPYTPVAGTAVVRAPQLSRVGGALGNGTVTFLLVNTTDSISEGDDLDAGDNGKLEGLPDDAVIVDSLAWFDGAGEDTVYTKAVLPLPNATPDAASRFSTNNTRNTETAWFGGNLLGTNGVSLTYDADRVTENFPANTAMSPGVTNNTAPQISSIPNTTATIGDPTAPPLSFTISDAESPLGALSVSASSDNPLVVTNLTLGGNGAQRTLTLAPHGAGYANITVSVSDGSATGRRTFMFAASQDFHGGGRFHSGASDGSTACAIDARWMFVADDESQTLRLYSRSNSGPPVVGFNMNPFLGLMDLYDDGSPREVDLEASTHVGNRIFWFGSHSHSGDAEVTTNRARIFATDLVGTGTNASLTYIGRYDYFKADLLAWDSHGEHGKGDNYYGLADSSREGVNPKDPGGAGFNIEGLAMAPNSTTTAYVGFRAPLVPPSERVKALIVPVTNFTTVAVSGAAPGATRFGVPIELNLGGRGIRSIEGSGTNFLIVAGPPGPASNTPPYDFKLFTWTGRPQDQPAMRAADLTGLNPEGIVELPKLPWTARSRVQLLSDNGTTIYYGDGVEAKHLPVKEFKKSRTDWVTLGDVVPQQPFLRSAVKKSSALKLTWHSVKGTKYRVQSKSTLDAPWQDVSGEVTAEAATTSAEVSGTGTTQEFYRVVAVE